MIIILVNNSTSSTNWQLKFKKRLISSEPSLVSCTNPFSRNKVTCPPDIRKLSPMWQELFVSMSFLRLMKFFFVVFSRFKNFANNIFAHRMLATGESLGLNCESSLNSRQLVGESLVNFHQLSQNSVNIVLTNLFKQYQSCTSIDESSIYGDSRSSPIRLSPITGES
jgi:hypothetical protein